jgi:hypothetical protein
MDDFPYCVHNDVYEFAHTSDVKGFLCFSIPKANKGTLFFKRRDGKPISFHEGRDMAEVFAQYNGKLIEISRLAVFKQLPSETEAIVKEKSEKPFLNGEEDKVVNRLSKAPFLYGEEYEVPLRNPNDEQNSKTPKDGSGNLESPKNSPTDSPLNLSLVLNSSTNPQHNPLENKSVASNQETFQATLTEITEIEPRINQSDNEVQEKQQLEEEQERQQSADKHEKKQPEENDEQGKNLD